MNEDEPKANTYMSQKITETRMPSERRQGEGQIKRLALRIRDEVVVSTRGRGRVHRMVECVIGLITRLGSLGIALERTRV